MIKKLFKKAFETTAFVLLVGQTVSAAAPDLSQTFSGVKLATSYKDQTAHNPVISHRFGADPYAMEYDGRVYVYMTHDMYDYKNGVLQTNEYGQINELLCISSADLVNWTDHGAIKAAGKSGVVKSGDNSWAPTACHKKINGKEKFFIYFANGGNGIAVISADSPTGPWTDPIGKLLITRSTPNCSNVDWLFDPAVLIDDDGTGYLYFGGGVPTGKDSNPGTARVVKLGADMVSLDGNPVTIEPPYLFEDAGANKIGDKYIYSYCTNWNCSGWTLGSATIAYMTSTKPMTGFTFTGGMFNNPGTFFSTDWGNNHHSMVKFKGNYYLFYHSLVLQKNMNMKNLGYRSTHVDNISVNESTGNITSAKGTLAGVMQLENVNPFDINEAETFAWQGGISTTAGGQNMLLSVETGDWIGVSGVDFANGASNIIVNVSSKNTGAIKVCLDKPNGTVLGYVEIPNTNGSLTSISSEMLSTAKGKHDLFFIFSGNFNFDYWTFGDGSNVAQSPYGDGPATLPGRIEAENYDLGGEGVAYHDTDKENKDGAYRDEGVDIGTNGDGYHIGWLETDEWLDYTVNIAVAGKYKFTVNLSNEDTESSFHFQIDGEDITPIIPTKNTKDWNVYDTISGYVELPAGKHVLTLVIDSRYINIDWFSFEAYQEPYGGVAHAIPGRIEAEDYDLGAEGVAYHDNTEENSLDDLTNVYRSDGVDIKGDKETGYRIGMTEKGEWLEYTVNIAVAGEYKWAMRVSTDNNTSAFHLELDDEVVVESTKTVNTGDWNVYDVATGSVTLPAGEHVLKIVIDESFFDIDWIEFSPVSTSQQIPLVEGWNLISINVEADDNSIESIFAEADVEQIKTDEIYWNKNVNPVFNMLTTIEPGKAYMVYANKAVTIEVKGMLTDKPNQELKAGWNMVGCNYQSEQELIDIYKTTDDCREVRTLDGVWAPNGKNNTITKQKPGNGYFILK